MMYFYFPAELIKAIEIGENPGGGGMGVVLYEMATCEPAFEDGTTAAIFDAYPSQCLLNLHRLRG
jgi:hypothetical protein